MGDGKKIPPLLTQEEIRFLLGTVASDSFLPGDGEKVSSEREEFVSGKAETAHGQFFLWPDMQNDDRM